MSNPDMPYELENQLVLRLPTEPARILRDALRSGASNLKDRLRLHLEREDIRKGTLYFDNFILPTKLVDLPCLMESAKTIDRKNLYKTADICQMLIGLEEEEMEEEPKQEKKKKDGTKIDKRYLSPHGITPPLKNARKRRFRKTLKKKQYSDQPELEKEVRRLLRADYEAAHINWELIDEEVEEKEKSNSTDVERKDVLMHGSKINEEPTPRTRDSGGGYGGLSGDSDLDEELGGGEELDDSRLSDFVETDSRQSDSVSGIQQPQEFKKERKSRDSSSSYVTSFSEAMFNQSMTLDPSPGSSSSAGHHSKSRISSSGGGGERSGHGGSRRGGEEVPTSSNLPSMPSTPGSSGSSSGFNRGELLTKLDKLKRELTEISVKRQIQETDIQNLENITLRKRMELMLNKLVNEQVEKEREISQVESLLSQY